jgi:Fumarylacetoacetate (FAA) hydrolase family
VPFRRSPTSWYTPSPDVAMKLCMFHPVGHPLERGWVGRIEGDRVVQLAAQTLQSFFTGGGSAREHAEYPLAEVVLLAPVLHPPAVRVFRDTSTFDFANPAAVLGPGLGVPCNEKLQGVLLAPRIAAVIGASANVAAFTILAEWRDPARRPPKDRDFALGLGPVAVTADAFDPEACVQVVRIDGSERLREKAVVLDWEAAVALAADRTRLFPGDLIAGPSCGLLEEVAPGSVVEIEVDGIGMLEQRIAG